MTDLSRRGFLGGVAACAVAAALPILPPPPPSPPIFAGSIGVYNGVLFRELADLRHWIAEDHRSASLILEALPSGRELAEMLRRTFAEAPYGR